jgi:predicted permease
MSLSSGDGIQPSLVDGVLASGNLFTVLGTAPALGRLFSPEDDGASLPVAVLSHDYWMRRFGGEPSVLGSTVEVNRRAFTVIGVAEGGFRGHMPLYDFQIFVPLGTMEFLLGVSPDQASVLTIGRLAPGATVSTVRGASDGVAQSLRRVKPADWASASFVVEAHSSSFQEFRGPISLFLGFLLALSACILIIICANLAGLMLSRATARSRDLAVRKALGAARRQLVGPMLMETFLLLTLGGILGLLASFLATGALGHIPMPVGLPLVKDFGPDLRVLAVSMGVTLVVGLLFGLAPALRATRDDMVGALRDDPGTTSGRQRLRKGLVVVQVAGAVVLLGGSGVLYKALRHAGAMDMGFSPGGVHVATVDLGIQQYTEEEGRAFFARLLEEVSVIPGVESAALADFLFLASPPERGGSFSTPGGGGGVMAGVFGASPGFFETMGVDVLEGRAFNDSDQPGGEPVAMVNETVARILWPNETAVGKTMISGEGSLTVVGVVRNSKYISIGESPLAGVFRPQAQYYIPKTSVVARVREGWPDLSSAVEQVVRGLDPEVPLHANGLYLPMVEAQLMPRRLAAWFAGALGALGLFLASIGLFGVLSNLVIQRLPEMAVRIALGAEPRRIGRSVLKGGILLVLAGLALGIPGAVAVSSLIRGFLYGMDPMDSRIMAGLSFLFVSVGVLSGLPAARRATRSDPALLLRRN